MFSFQQINKFLLLTIAMNTTLQAANQFPRGCEITGYGYNQNYLVLNETGKQAYYLIQNRSNSRVELEQLSAGEGFMTPPLHAVLDPMSWGAFASDVQNLNFKCYQNTGENATLIPCSEVLEVCQYPRARFALSNMGNYWIAFNKPQNEIIQESVTKGIYLKW